MSTLWEMPAVLAALLAWLAAPPATIGEAAARETLRRELAGKATRLYTNVDLPPALGQIEGMAAEGPEPETAADPSASAGTRDGASGPAAAAIPPAAETRDQAWWQNRVAAIRESLERNTLRTEAMQARINVLTADVVSRDDPFQRAELRLQLQQALTDYDRLQALVIENRQSLERLRDEARRAGVPPGWTR